MKEFDIIELVKRDVDKVIYYEITINILSHGSSTHHYFNPYRRLLKVLGIRLFLFLLVAMNNTGILNNLDYETLTLTEKAIVLGE